VFALKSCGDACADGSRCIPHVSMSTLPSATRHHVTQFSVNDGTLLRALLQSVPDIVYFKDRESRFIAVSTSLVVKHGMGAPDDVIGKCDFDFFADRFAQQGFDEEQRIMRTLEPMLNVPVKETWADGHVTWSLNTKLPLHDETGEVVGIVGIGKDITKAKEMEQALEKAQRDLINASRMAGMAEVATGVLHNVGNVLNSLNVSTSVLSSGLQQMKVDSLTKVTAMLRENSGNLASFLADDPRGRKFIDFLEAFGRQLGEDRTRLLEETAATQKNVDHIKEIVSMQQAYATMVGVVEALDPAMLMDDSLRLNAAALTRHRVRVVREYGNVAQVVGERGKVLQILVNLIRNAKYACSDHDIDDKIVFVGLEPGAQDTVRFIVRDNGVGIPPENLTRIFMHGFTTRSGGHGFGLHSSALAAKEMKGSLTATSDGLGKGATFVLELPCANAPGSPLVTTLPPAS
jgi:PAS domain S-box-containing protein